MRRRSPLMAAIKGGAGGLPVAEVDDGIIDRHGLSRTLGPWEGQAVSEHPATSENETGSGDAHRAPRDDHPGSVSARVTAGADFAALTRRARTDGFSGSRSGRSSTGSYRRSKAALPPTGPTTTPLLPPQSPCPGPRASAGSTAVVRGVRHSHLRRCPRRASYCVSQAVTSIGSPDDARQPRNRRCRPFPSSPTGSHTTCG